MKITFPDGNIKEFPENSIRFDIAKCISIITIAITMLLSGCASIFKGNFEKVNFYSNPSNADVYINGQFAGITPLLDVKLRSNLSDYTYLIEIRKKGFVPYKTTINTKLHAGYVALDVIAFLPTFGIAPAIDSRNGSWYTFDENDIRTILRYIPE